MRRRTRGLSRWRYGFLAAVVVVLGACGGGVAVRPFSGMSSASAKKFLIVDCLLPSQVRRHGTAATYITARRPAKLPASECEIRGGEYVAYDRADLRTSLDVWLTDAQAGDPRAQTYVGEIYEKGMGVPPDYATAAQWYRKAAGQGSARAQANLGYLYEKGLGVRKDPVQAMNWYRRASGLGEELVAASSVRQLERELSASRGATAAARAEAAELSRRLRSVESELQRKRSEEKRAEQRLDEAKADPGKVRVLEQRLAEQARERHRLEEEARRLEAQLAAAQPGTGALPPRPVPAPVARVLGNYYALVIGNDDYENFPRLKTAVSDAMALASVLREHYGFRTTLLINATYAQILSTLNEFRQKLTAKDNLLIYYAGHGRRDARDDRGYWIPVDASADDRDFWVANDGVTGMVDTFKARHVMVIADSVYAGRVKRYSFGSVQPGRPPAEQKDSLQKIAHLRSRTVLSSGGVQPVPGTGANSVFAQQLLAVLQENNRILEGPELYLEVARRVRGGSAGAPLEPQYGPIKYAGDQLAPFVFLPREA